MDPITDRAKEQPVNDARINYREFANSLNDIKQCFINRESRARVSA